MDISTGQIGTIAKDTPRAFKVGVLFRPEITVLRFSSFKSKHVARFLCQRHKMSTNLVTG